MSNSQGNVSDSTASSVQNTGKPRNPDGTFAKGQTLTREKAQAMVAAKQRKREQGNGTVADLVAEAGYTDADCPTSVRLMAEQAAAGGARSVQAMREFMRLTGDKQPEAAPAVTDPVSLVVEAVGAEKLMEICREARKVAGGPPRR